ncbi:hypothetical protein L3X38_027270 [Prunus dulcis]|uniref:RNase H type-1 domain-containing protein n=1 Tax=Prunus dulcis TaxID=3755 RepID=A0AAD4VP49_PRUDU|nr:hypothetical protein L3X38_027270 [Prunus dulcis]
MEEIGATVLAVYMRYLHDVLKQANMCSMVGFIDPARVSANSSTIADRSRLVPARLQKTDGEQIFMMPYNPGLRRICELIQPVQSELEEDNHGVSENLRWLAAGPNMAVPLYRSYLIKGIKFNIKAQDDVRTTQNSGVYLLAHTMQVASAKDKNPILSNMGFYGVIQEIWDLDYQKFTIPVFRCDWIDSSGLVVDELGFTLVDLSKIGHRNDQFVLASQVKQIFFIDDPMHRGWSVVLSMPNREYNDVIGDEVLGDVIIECEPFTRGMPNVDTFDELVGELGGQNIRVLFAEANSTQARVLKNCLERFCNASGQTVNYDKSVVFCSPNTRKETAKEVSLICGSPLTEDLGRATLIQAVTFAIPIYAMQTSKLPVSVGQELDKLNRNSFWGGSEKKLKIHLCQWDLACRPKHKGGLGFKKTTAMNKALLAKVGWRLHKNDKRLWAKIYESKYLKGKSVLDSSLMFRQDCSTTWKGVMYGVELLRQGIGWRVGKGDTTKFWKDSWLIDEPLLKHDGVLHIEDIDCSVSNFFKDEWWDLDKLLRALTEDLVQHVVNYPVGFASNLRDCQIWKGTANGVFSVKTAYNMFFKGPSWPDYSFSSLWKLKIPPKLKIFAWLTVRNHQVFQGDEDVSSDPKQLIVRAVHEWFKASHVFCKHNHKVQVDLKWEPPISGQFKLNVDGSRRNGSGHIGARGVIRNSSGDWISGFAVNLGKGQILEAEIWGLFFGLKLALDKEINNLVVEMDSALAVQLIQKQRLTDVHPLAALVASCWELMHKIN